MLTAYECWIHSSRRASCLTCTEWRQEALRNHAYGHGLVTRGYSEPKHSQENKVTITLHSALRRLTKSVRSDVVAPVIAASVSVLRTVTNSAKSRLVAERAARLVSLAALTQPLHHELELYNQEVHFLTRAEQPTSL